MSKSRKDLLVHWIDLMKFRMNMFIKLHGENYSGRELLEKRLKEWEDELEVNEDE
jgi:hypothetical protein